MPVKNKDVHVCNLHKGKWCDCQDVPPKILRKARGALEELRTRTLKGVKNSLKPANLFCKECQHAGMLMRPIFGRAPGDNVGYACNAEEDFAICPNCGHCAVISSPFTLKAGSKI